MTRDRQRRIGFAVGLLALSFLAFADPPPAPPIWEEKLDEAQDLFEEGKHNDAVKAFKEADKLAKGACLECRIGLARTFNKLGAHKEALKHVDAALKMTSDKGQLARLYNEQGIALMAMADKDQKQLEQAEKAFRQVLELTEGTSNVARFNLGYTLLRLSKDAEGVALLKEYLAKDPAAESAEDAKYLLENPVRARKRLIPDFQLVTLEGEYLTSEDLRGKVVLLDFWGTWCAPCVAALPNLRLLSKSMADDPFVLVSISSDSDQAMLREFIAKHKMTWPQVWDEQQVLIRKLQIHSYPTYVLIDPAGEIIHAARGAGGGVEEQLRQKIHAAVRAAKKSAKKGG